MTVEHFLSDEELDEYLREDPALFVEAVFESRRRHLMRYIKRVSWGSLSPHELADVFQDTMKGLWECVSRPGIDPTGSMRIVYRIARNRAISARWKKSRLSSHSESNQELVESHALADLDGTSFRIRWKFADPLEKAELDRALVKILPTLPDRQRVVAQLFFEMYEELRERGKYPPLAEAVSKITGQSESVVAVKSALQAAMEKIRLELERRGHPLVTGRVR